MSDGMIEDLARALFVAHLSTGDGAISVASALACWTYQSRQGAEADELMRDHWRGLATALLERLLTLPLDQVYCDDWEMTGWARTLLHLLNRYMPTDHGAVMQEGSVASAVLKTQIRSPEEMAAIIKMADDVLAGRGNPN